MNFYLYIFMKKRYALLMFFFIGFHLKANNIEDLIDTIAKISTQKGIASHYGTKFHNRKTASGERLDILGNTAAHKNLPFGTIVKIINNSNDKATLVRINDRGPFIKGRIIDITPKSIKIIDGFDNPIVDIEYFDNNILEQLDSNYLLGYSINKSLIILHKSLVSIIDTINNFEGAMNFYLDEIKKNSSLYLFIKVDKALKQQYFIGLKN